MAQDGSEEQPNPIPSGTQEPTDDERLTAEFDMELVPKLPRGRAVFPVERDGRWVWLVAEGGMTKQCFNEMRTYLQHITANGMWPQSWDDGPQPVSPTT
ncbi:hypothetical protein AB0D33_01545 [Streptomyces sp. NPDC048404]|jgi:hypothetical protein|uniref:hypothetical protein n=1 Tax=unclassified Streptomyces TaxID=2593676 RepID=UPI0034442746